MRYAILAAALLIQSCLGATYAWAVFVGPLREATGLGQGAVQTPFTLFYVAFPATTIVAGMLLPRIGTRASAVIGGLFFGAGWILAGSGDGNFTLVVLGVGVLGGIGVGFAYLVPIATLVLWFPRRRGLVTGIAVAGFGGGAAVVSRVADHLMGVAGGTPFGAARTLGLAFLLLVPLAGLAMRRPPASVAAPHRAPVSRIVTRDRRFLVLYGAMLAGLAAGLGVNANLEQIGSAAGSSAGLAAVAWFAVANAAGRIVWGAWFDRASPRGAIVTNLAGQAALLLAAPLLVGSPAGLQFFAALAGFHYGGVLVLYAATAADLWGADRVGGVYGWLFSANIPASFAAILAGLAFDRWGDFTVPLAALALLAILGALPVLRVLRPSTTPPAASP
jgi:OFA family oxalate/formate antiporter-like MFS transporter